MAKATPVPVLSVRQLARVFDVTEMTIYNWRKETVNKTALPKRCTAEAVRRWADGNMVSMRHSPELLLGKYEPRKPGPKPAVKRNAAGKLSSVRAARAG